MNTPAVAEFRRSNTLFVQRRANFVGCRNCGGSHRRRRRRGNGRHRGDVGDLHVGAARRRAGRLRDVRQSIEHDAQSAAAIAPAAKVRSVGAFAPTNSPGENLRSTRLMNRLFRRLIGCTWALSTFMARWWLMAVRNRAGDSWEARMRLSSPCPRNARIWK